ncbi:cysteine desulfurase family protein [Galactobacter caseinivorans]|uniref:Cysteine desulfurase n=1 Tax=Galactobacter caseinivorans TaxID=2676123 RepID=A0A496PJH4_9MICC|nr:cysteine desulfurase family protein [Galactobacter caseinivorans]RKW70617.1 cysteine desulfurase [Galactobacter caseinivorans]
MIHLDAAATQPVRPEILAAVLPLFTEQFGNPASHHEAGEAAGRALDWARSVAAQALGVRPGRVIFTSGGTESNAMALHGLALARPRGRHVLVSAIEHPSVLRAAAQLGRWHGFEVQTIPVGLSGVVDPADVAARLRPDTTLVALMAVNNEVGTVQPVPDVARLAHAAGARVHVDAVQAGTWLGLEHLAAAADTLAVSGHKLGGMKGAGLLALGRGIELEPLLDGGGQEDGRRSGTVNVPGAVSTALALKAAAEDVAAYASGVAACGQEPGKRMAGVVLGGLAGALGGLGGPGVVQASLSGDAERRVPGIVSFVFDGVHAESVLIELGRRGVLASSGSACAAGSSEPSEVLTAMGWDAPAALGALRLSFSPSAPAADLEAAAGAVVESVLAVAGRGANAGR